MRSTLLLAAGLALGATACGEETNHETPGTGGAPNEGGGGDGTGASGGGTGDGGSTGSFGTGGGGGAESGCKKVDFLFVIDNSVSMNDEQDALVASFPGFMETIQSTITATSDYHTLVADTDAWGRCNTANPWTGETPTNPTCNDYIEATVFEECDRVRGAGVVHPAGELASNMKCDVFGGNRYIVQDDPDAAATFACMAKVGTAGHPSERPIEAIVGAVSPDLNGAEGCNAGFLRSDAVLVITFISDDPNYEDTGTPQSWYDAVVAAKGGNAEAVVVLGLTPYDGGTAGAHWHEFIGLWGARGLEASVALPDYTPFFSDAVALIDDTCEQFVPR